MENAGTCGGTGTLPKACCLVFLTLGRWSGPRGSSLGLWGWAGQSGLRGAGSRQPRALRPPGPWSRAPRRCGVLQASGPGGCSSPPPGGSWYGLEPGSWAHRGLVPAAPPRLVPGPGHRPGTGAACKRPRTATATASRCACEASGGGG